VRPKRPVICESGSNGAAKQAKLMKHQPQNTEIENSQITQLLAVGYSAFP
jgi:hypothetical protein